MKWNIIKRIINYENTRFPLQLHTGCSKIYKYLNQAILLDNFIKEQEDCNQMGTLICCDLKVFARTQSCFRQRRQFRSIHNTSFFKKKTKKHNNNRWAKMSVFSYCRKRTVYHNNLFLKKTSDYIFLQSVNKRKCLFLGI